MSKLNRERVEQLIKALRSGTYKQGRSRLRIGDRYCCLGVACEISGIGKWESSNWPKEFVYVTKNREDNRASLVKDVQAWYGTDSHHLFFFSIDKLPDELKSRIPRNVTTAYKPKGYISPVVLNDNGADFDLIADIMEWALNNEELVKTALE